MKAKYNQSKLYVPLEDIHIGSLFIPKQTPKDICIKTTRLDYTIKDYILCVVVANIEGADDTVGSIYTINKKDYVRPVTTNTVLEIKDSIDDNPSIDPEND